MKNLIFYLYFISALLTYSNNAFAIESNQLATGQAFQDADQMDNDLIDAAEFETYFEKIFPSFDLNSDGKVTFGECVRGNFSANPGVDQAAVSGQVSYRFQAIDANDDKIFDLEEYIAYARDRFPYYDSNGDGSIDIDEFHLFYNESLPCSFQVSPNMTKD